MPPECPGVEGPKVSEESIVVVCVWETSASVDVKCGDTDLIVDVHGEVRPGVGVSCVDVSMAYVHSGSVVSSGSTECVVCVEVGAPAAAWLLNLEGEVS